METLAQLVKRSKKRLLQMHFESGVGHLGGNLSCLDTLMVLYHKVLGSDDLFILSKGHSAGALYITLWSKDVLTENDLKSFHKDDTILSAHPPPQKINAIPFATGSLGHGFPLSVGLALGRKLRKQPGRVFCLMSDGEWEEGSNWEALLFSVHHGLDSLILILDWNGFQGFGSTQEVAGLSSITEKLHSFGLEVEEIDGHNLESIEKSLSRLIPGPRAIIAHTTKGQGISFMENKMEWHYLTMSEVQYQQALEEIG
jgi:transketolase